jgi:hypothetical protein
MLVHYFWLFEFKFVFEFICLSPFFKLFEPLFLFPSTYPFWPDFCCSPSAQSPLVHLFFFGLVHRVAAQLGSATQLAKHSLSLSRSRAGRLSSLSSRSCPCRTRVRVRAPPRVSLPCMVRTHKPLAGLFKVVAATRGSLSPRP